MTIKTCLKYSEMEHTDGLITPFRIGTSPYRELTPTGCLTYIYLFDFYLGAMTIAEQTGEFVDENGKVFAYLNYDELLKYLKQRDLKKGIKLLIEGGFLVLDTEKENRFYLNWYDKKLDKIVEMPKNILERLKIESEEDRKAELEEFEKLTVEWESKGWV